MMALGEVRESFTICGLKSLVVQGQDGWGIPFGDPFSTMDVEVELKNDGTKLVLTLKDRGNGTDGD